MPGTEHAGAMPTKGLVLAGLASTRAICSPACPMAMEGAGLKSNPVYTLKTHGF